MVKKTEKQSMTTEYPWAEAAEVSAEILNQHLDTLPQGVSILSWLFENGKINSKKYFNWAQNKYQIAQIKPDYQIQNKSTEFQCEFWNNSLFPFYKWDNVLYVSCLQPPSPKVTEQIHAKLHLQIVYVLNPFCYKMSETLAEETPQGLKTSDVTSIDFSSLVSDLESENMKLQMDKTPSSIKIPQNIEKSDLQPEAPLLPLEQIDFSSISSVTNTNTKKLQAVPPPIPPSMPPTIPPPPHKKADAETVLSPQGKTSFLSSIESHCREDYKKLMILFFENEKLKPFEWDSGWQQDITMQPYIDLTRPSIFQIVLKSKEPFHGGVSPSAVNDAFFATYHQSNYPEFASVFPILAKGKIIGMLVGLTSAQKGKKINLEKYEDVCGMISRILFNSPKVA